MLAATGEYVKTPVFPLIVDEPVDVLVESVGAGVTVSEELVESAGAVVSLPYVSVDPVGAGVTWSEVLVESVDAGA